jgi:phosphoenolpyruvate-protein kinase (PTS system EI component)
LWAPFTAEPAGGGFEEFRRARGRFVEGAAELPDDLGPMYETLANDPTWEEGISARLAAGAVLSDAIVETAEEAAATLRTLPDPYLAARGDDLVQLGSHFVRLLAPETPEPPEDAILCARDVSAVELQRWSPLLSGVALIGVAPTAHLAIVARGLGLPAVVLDETCAAQLPAPAAMGTATPALLQGFEGWLEIGPDPALAGAYPAERISARPDPAPVFARGRTVGVFANLNAASDAALAAGLGADGVGLLRTEFLYVDRAEPPPVEEEVAAYRTVAAAFAGKPIVARTLDLGGDKLGAPFRDDGVDHGMLGVRGIRLTLRHPDLFARHLRALVTGFAGTDLRIMFPMVAVPEEFARARDALDEVLGELNSACRPQLGLMLEIPAAAFALDEFARAGARFVSLGTNDLAQYFFASDRLGAEHARYEIPKRAAWRAFLRDALAKAKAAGLEAGVCGEAAGDATLSEFWLTSGVDELSVAPALIPWLKSRLRSISSPLAPV